MPKQNNNDPKLKYLKRDDVRTMGKDVSRLRERETETAREKIAKMRTGEEAQKETERLAELKQATEEREKTELETKKEEENLQRLRTQRGALAELEAAAAARAEKEQSERFRAKFDEAQIKEEEERKRFLENIGRQSGEEVRPEPLEPEPQRTWPEPPPVPTWPTPPPPPPVFRPAPPAVPPIGSEPVEPEYPPAPKPEPVPFAPAPEEKRPIEPPIFPPTTKKPFGFPGVQIPKVPVPKIQIPRVPMPRIEGYFPEKPSLFANILVRIVVFIFVLAILATIATFWYWYLVVRPAENTPQPTPPQEETPTPPIPPPASQLFINDKILSFGYYIPAEPRTIDTIVIHSVYNALSQDHYSLDGVIEEYKTYQVAAHYLVARDAKIYQTAPQEAVAYHAGASQMPDGRTNVNNFSIGIEVVYTKDESPTEQQYLALTQLVKYLREKYNIPVTNIVGHKDIAPGRKDDPWNFDWGKLVDNL